MSNPPPSSAPPPARIPLAGAGSVDAGRFFLCGCQGGAEAALQQRVAALMPAARPGVWRRGIVTFRIPPAAGLAARPVPLEAVEEPLSQFIFARTTIHSLGQVSGACDATRVAAAIAAAGSGYQTVHVWQRDPKAELPVAAIRAGLLAALGLDPAVAELARPHDRVLDCVLDSVDRWWIGWHQSLDPASRWPGGIYPAAAPRLPPGTVSRAWLKLDEAIALFAIPFQPGQQALELGAAPGGACQRLLEAGLAVVGVDPAVVDERVAANPDFQQWRMRARDVPLKRCSRTDWLLTDMNIDPVSTMAALGRIATAPAVQLRGIVATLKLPEWSRAAEVPGWLDMFRSWGFEPRARQLSTGGREICVVALRSEPPSPAGGRRTAAGKVNRRPATRRPDR